MYENFEFNLALKLLLLVTGAYYESGLLQGDGFIALTIEAVYLRSNLKFLNFEMSERLEFLSRNVRKILKTAYSKRFFEIGIGKKGGKKVKAPASVTTFPS